MGIRVLDLFCGGGGSSWGARAAGAEIVCGVDAWKIATDTYGDNFPLAHAKNLTLGEHSSVADIGADIGQIDLILASPECTNHTPAKGSAPRDEDSKRTARYILNFADELKPRWMVLENVIQMRGWDGYVPLMDDLKRLGYYVSPQLLDASAFGVPQTRRRLFLLCDRERMPDAVPVASVDQASAKIILDAADRWRSRPLQDRVENTIARADKGIAELGRGEDFLLVYYGSDGSGGWQPLTRPLRTLTTLDRFGLVTWDDDKPLLRMLQVSELQRAMGFDETFKLERGSRRDRIKLLGNGVCPPVMTSIVGSLISQAQAVAAE